MTDRTPEEWSRAALAVTEWLWPHNVDHPAAAGHLLAMVWPHLRVMRPTFDEGAQLVVIGPPGDGPIEVREATVGRACVRALELLAEVGRE